jgi:hypothetical protein
MPKDAPHPIEVDGEIFEVVSASSDGTGFHYTWLTGRNRGYGFSSWAVGGVPNPAQRHVTSIQGFLAQIDPATGFIFDDDDE